MLLSLLPQGTLFNVIAFGTTFTEAFFKPHRMTDETKQSALTFLKGFSPNLGNTDAWRFLETLGLLSVDADDASTTNVFVVSDGHVSNMADTVATVRQTRSTCRVFTFGVG